MSDLRSWWGGTKTDDTLLVARDEAAAAKIAGLRPADLPFKFRPRLGPLPLGVERPGLYRNAGGIWVTSEKMNVSPPPDLEESS